ncbi:hypothetical protein ACE6H2_018388 [Prunus campanulata]
MLVFCIFQFVSCGFLLSIDIVILNMLSDMFSAEILYMKRMKERDGVSLDFGIAAPHREARTAGY